MPTDVVGGAKGGSHPHELSEEGSHRRLLPSAVRPIVTLPPAGGHDEVGWLPPRFGAYDQAESTQLGGVHD